MTEGSKVLVLVEGQTEEKFIREVLAPSLTTRRIWLIPTIIVTKRTGSSPAHKGGISTYAKLRTEVARLCGDSSAAMITTMVDYYGLPSDVPRGGPGTGQASAVDTLELGWAKDIGDPRFVPNIVKYEFETLLFADPAAVEHVFDRRVADEVRAVRSKFQEAVENINDGAQTAPSRRMLRIVPRYQKVTDGVRVCARAGLPAIRSLGQTT